MEKRLVTSLILSFLVLYVWSALTYKPKENVDVGLEKEQQTIAAEEVISTPISSSSSFSVDATPQANLLKPNPSVKPNIDTIESEKLRVTLTNLGGSISSIELVDFDQTFPLTDVIGIAGYDTLPYVFKKDSDRSVRYVYSDTNVEVVKQYTLSNNDQIIHANVSVENKTDASKLVNLKINGVTLDMSNLDEKSKDMEQSRDKALYEYVLYSKSNKHRRNNAHKFSDKDEHSFGGQADWVAYRDRYYSVIVKPDYETSRFFSKPLGDNSLSLGFEVESTTLPPGGSIELAHIIYAGPEELNKLAEYKLGFEKVKKFYRLTLFDAISKIIYEILHWVHKFVDNWGLCIIIISVLIYFSMYPLTLRGMSSMKKIQALQPKMTALREKYKDNPQRLQKETMELYKEHRINPIGGCVPFLFQMPVFIGLYQVLWRDVAFKGAEFLWIKDLSAPDRLFPLGFKIPLLGWEYFNLLPFLMMGIMFVQTKLQQKNMTSTDPAQQAQQKMMTIFMPIFLCFIFYTFASGLTLYFTMFYIFSAMTQFIVSREPKGA